MSARDNCSLTGRLGLWGLIAILLGVGLAPGQSRFKPEDVVTWSDSREVNSVMFSHREVYFITNGGVWRLDRWTGDILTPWAWGRGWDRSIFLGKGQLCAWHEWTNTLWLASSNGLYYYRPDLERWSRMKWNSAQKAAALGTNYKYLVIDHGEEIKRNRYELIEPFIARVEAQSDSAPPEVIWNRPLLAGSYPNYNIISDDHLTYMPGSGQIKDWKFRTYIPAFDMEDAHYDRRYICYPGLGLGIADESRQSLDIIIPGPAGSDVKAIAFRDGGFLCIGGESEVRDGGINLFDRSAGRWQRFDAELTSGLESHRIRDILIHKDRIYFASNAGLVIFQPELRRWKTLNRFNGLTSLELRVLAVAAGQLFIGSDQGVNRMTLPQGLISSSGNETVDETACADIASEGDTVWIAGMTGVYRWDPQNEWQRLGAEEPVVGDEAARCLDIHHDRLWIGGRRGLRELNRRTGTWQGWPAGTYLRGLGSVSLESNDSLLWVGTTRGLFVINYRKGSWLSYQGEMGLPASAVQTLALEADSLWMGSSQGLTRFIWNRPERDVF